MAIWRVGSRVPQHVYREDTPVCTVPAHTAAYIVRALNVFEAVPTPLRLRKMAEALEQAHQDDLELRALADKLEAKGNQRNVGRARAFDGYQPAAHQALTSTPPQGGSGWPSQAVQNAVPAMSNSTTPGHLDDMAAELRALADKLEAAALKPRD